MMRLCLLLSAVLVADCVAQRDHKVIRTRCKPDNDTCFILFKADRDVITWKQAYDYCHQTHTRLAAILDSNTQATIKQLNSMTKPLGDGHAWVAGRRSGDTSWYDVTGSIYTGKVYETYKSSQTKCVQLLRHNVTRRWTRLEAQPCYAMSPSTLSRALCQYSMTPDMTPCEGYNQSKTCYVSSANYMRTWYDARSYCMATYPGGNLAYSHLSSKSLRDYFWGESRIAGGFNLNLWVGIERNPWKWINDGEELPVTYSAWYPEEGAGLNEDCLIVDLNADSRWADKACSYTSSYFICQYNATAERPVLAKTSAQETTSTPAVTESDATTKITAVKESKDWSTTIIVSTLIGLLFMIMLISLVICVMKDRRKWSKSLLRRILAYGHYGGNGSGTAAPDRQGHSSSDWTNIVMEDRLDQRSLDERRMSEASSVSVGIDLASVSGFPPQGRDAAGPVGTAEKGCSEKRKCLLFPETLSIEAMAEQSQKPGEEGTYVLMSSLAARKRNKDDARTKSARWKLSLVDPELSGRESQNPVYVKMDSQTNRPSDSDEDPMYVVRITLPQQDVATSTIHGDGANTGSCRSPTSGSESHYKTPRPRPPPVYAAVSKRTPPAGQTPAVDPEEAAATGSGYKRDAAMATEDLDIIKEVELVLRKIDQIE